MLRLREQGDAQPVLGDGVGRHEEEALLLDAQFAQLDGVESVVPISRSYKLVSREVKPENSVVFVKGVPVGGGELVFHSRPAACQGLSPAIAPYFNDHNI